MSTSLLEDLRAAGFELRPAVEGYREEALRETGVILQHPHRCRGCGQWVEGRKLDDHEPVCARPERLRAYRRRKSEAAQRSVHVQFHVRRGVFKETCTLCWAERAGRQKVG